MDGGGTGKSVPADCRAQFQYHDETAHRCIRRRPHDRVVKVDPDQARAQGHLKRVVVPPDMDAVSGSEKGFRRHIEWFEDDLHQTGRPWICGDQFTLADICVGVILTVSSSSTGSICGTIFLLYPGGLRCLKNGHHTGRTFIDLPIGCGGPRKSVAKYPFDDNQYAPRGTIHDWCAD